MRPLNLKLVAALGVGTLALGSLAAAVAVRYGSSPLLITPWVSVLFVIIGVWLLIGGRAVKRLKARKDTWVSAAGAAKIAVLARSSAYVTSGATGFLGGVTLVSAMRLWAPAMAQSAITGLVGALTALFACVCAVVVERWCISDSSDDDDHGFGRTDRSAPSPQAQ